MITLYAEEPSQMIEALDPSSLMLEESRFYQDSLL
jgi:hypothetical protein